MNSTLSYTGWSGGIYQIAAPAKLVTVYGNWVVPSVQRKPGATDYDSPWASSAWVGLDGDGSGDVLQGGTAHRVDVVNGVDTPTYYAWYEWYPNIEIEIDNFDVAPGDAMFAYIHYEGPDPATQAAFGSAWLVNLSTGTNTSVFFYEPGATPSFPNGYQGNCAECIMEVPLYSTDGKNYYPHNFVHYGELAFTNFGACADDHTFYNATDLITAALTNGQSDAQLSQDIVCRPLL